MFICFHKWQRLHVLMFQKKELYMWGDGEEAVVGKEFLECTKCLKRKTELLIERTIDFLSADDKWINYGIPPEEDLTSETKHGNLQPNKER